MSLALLEIADRMPFQAGFCLSVQMTCQQKGGGQTKVLTNACDRVVANLQNTFVG
jgi:Flp pilus assembly protein TadB